MLVDLNTGQVIASAANFNRQMHLGDDVLTRINLCSTDKSMVARLHEAVVHESVERRGGGSEAEAERRHDERRDGQGTTHRRLLSRDRGVEGT